MGNQMTGLAGLIAACILAASLGALDAQAGAPTRRAVFKYNGGSVKDEGNGRWVEYRNDGSKENFVEVKRTWDCIELLDRSRGYSVRLYGSAWYIKGGTVPGLARFDSFVELGDGSWAK